MKNIFKTVILFSLAALVSCSDELDINTNPNNPKEINAGLALSSAETSLITVTGGDLMNLGGFWAQYYTQAPSAGQYRTIDQYNINVSYADRLWAELYAGCLNDLKYVEENSDSTGTTLIAASLRAYTYQILVDLFDAVPYTEALQGQLGNITPTPTPGNEIYTDLIAKIDAALAAYAASPVDSNVGKQDIIYGADMDNWVKFANTLKLKLYIRMAYTPQANPAAVNSLLAENNFLTVDAAYANFSTSTDKTNPFYGVQISTNQSNAGTGLGDVNNIASNSLMNFYVENNDPRIGAVYRYAFKQQDTDPTVYKSIQQGTGEDNVGTASAYSRPNIRPKTPVFLMTAAESNFLQAEALIRYAGGAGAKEKYDAGIIASFDTYKMYFFTDNDVSTESTPYTADPVEVQALIDGNYAYVAGGDVETTVRQVIIQKWAALAEVNNIESYIETTRTKFPEVVEEGTENYAIGNRIPSSTSVLTGTTVPSILFYPLSEVNRNPNMQQRGSLIEKVWWDQK
jgi:hypothetical protein